MDFSFTDTQRALSELADRVFAAATPERLKEVAASADRIDRDLWAQLARSHLLGVAIPERHGGSGYGLIEVCLVLEGQGRAVAPVPLAPSFVAATVLTGEALERVASGEAFVSCAIAEGAAADPYRPSCEVSGGRLRGSKVAVPAAHVAERVVVTTSTGLVAVDPRADGVSIRREETTSGEPRFTLAFSDAPCEPLGGDVERFVQTATVAACALQVGVSERALRMTAEYTSAREQFGRPLGSFQAVQQRAADAYIDVEAMRWTTWLAAWRLAEGLDAADAVAVAKFWAAEAGQRVIASAQHLHGGIGVDVDYPLHRYLLWSKMLEQDLGAATPQLAHLGARFAAGAEAGSL